MSYGGIKKGVKFHARAMCSDVTGGECITCGRSTRRSWRTGILHKRCYGCRYLVMIYGPSITVEYTREYTRKVS